MPILGSLIKRGIKLRQKTTLRPLLPTPLQMQRKVLKKLLTKARDTEFGQAYGFREILHSFATPQPDEFYYLYRRNVPIYNYNQIFEQWWKRAKAGERDVCWPGQVRYFALSSGTSEASTKHIPITKEMTRAIQRTGTKQIFTLGYYNLPTNIFEKGILMLGGSTHLNYSGTFFEGDLSGIQASQIPFWFQHFYKPGPQIAKETDWNAKLDEITRRASDWDIGVIVGVPAWIQILLEKIIHHYQVATIHDIWPNLTIYCHGGVSFEPYRKGFEKLLAHPLTYIETYLASEGFVAYQSRPNPDGMKLVLDNGIFMEFVPFNDRNFDDNGELVADPETLMIHQIEEEKEYALLLSTCAGTWRYLIGDTVKLTNRALNEIVITGRTKHFLSLCGEHLSVDNMNKAVRLVAEELNLDIKEFGVAGIPHDSLFAHRWWIGTDDPANAAEVRQRLDDHLKVLNDDYRVERIAALKEVSVQIVPSALFYKWMKLQGKEGGQNKFPRVLKKNTLAQWEAFLREEGIDA
ncbi:GH3 auxin-responsive promoter [Catalinimonas alkaloidigena]|uniref:GH3 auxin-responsive promoter n=1 Tax=Catalinimonas alkaloidigena TaxID=1075417 RepID=A0A1G9BDI1_9BACT|nr:GH3 auxin-responsive promoter family protein [Catalinimonas alkaloidigena]SDK37602.1 GH3 auxin-responsive promoter [Catalinimonas alkaloidigena]